MPVFLEFLLVAFLIYLWESGLWLPKQAVALRRSWFSKKWKAIPATRFLATRDLGVVPMFPIPPDSGLAPCASFPLVVDESEKIFMVTADGDFHETIASSWDDIRFSGLRLTVGDRSIRCQSPVVADLLRNGRKAGLSPQNAIRRIWSTSLSPNRAKRELKRWHILTSPFRFYCPVLTIGFFIGIPAAYFYLGSFTALMLGAWLWCLMLAISLNLFYLAKRGYPAARSEIKQDAFLSLFIPFHAMRALEISSVHAFARTHPAAMILLSGDFSHRWLGKFVRSILFPRPDHSGDHALASTVLRPLKKQILSPDHFKQAPDHSEDPEASSYCPRCHSMFMLGQETCSDCGGMELRKFQSSEENQTNKGTPP
ncbi:MAG: hypothetical protein ACSHX9_17015 [Luteolibacter sp.]